MAPTNIVDRLPIVTKIAKWFRGDQTVIDGPLFKLHYQASTFMIMVGFIFVFVENHLDVKAILCQTGPQFSQYANQYCWIHGTAYVRSHLQGQATGCFVDQSRIEGEADAPVTAYYLWLPYLLSLCFAFAKLPHSAWKRFFENELIKHILDGSSGGGGGGHQGGNNQGGNQGNQGNLAQQLQNMVLGPEMAPEMSPTPGPKPGKGNKGQNNNNQGGGNNNKGNNKGQNQGNLKYREIAENFLEFRARYPSYHISFGVWEFMNGVCVFASMCVTHWLLNYKFFQYGIQVFNYVETQRTTVHPQELHDPMCELFPTEVSCSIQIGASTGGVDKSNFLCILGNNLFNQKYFFVLWVWWVFLLIVALLGLLYRLARILLPDFSRYLLLRKVHGSQLSNTRLRSADYFVLEQVLANLPSPKLKDQVLDEIDKRCEESGETFALLSSVGHSLHPGHHSLHPGHQPPFHSPVKGLVLPMPSLYPHIGKGPGAPSAPEQEPFFVPGVDGIDGEGSSSSNSSHSTATAV